MTKPIPTTKEHLVYFLQNNVSLGTYDKRFINNIIDLYLVPKKPVTSNQNDLLDKIVLRYSRQLYKFEIFAEQAIQLKWTINPVPSLPKFTQAHITINEGQILVHSPFKQEFVKEFREMKYTKWDKQEKTWFVPYTELTLKQVIQSVNKHYTTVNYCETIHKTLNQIECYSNVKYWNPTLININGRLLIAATNGSLDEALKDIELNDSLPTLARLAYRGITIGESVINNLPNNLPTKKILFAIERHCSFEHDPDVIIDFLKTIKADFVSLPEWSNGSKETLNAIKQKLKENNINYEVSKLRSTPIIDLRQTELPVMINTFSFNVTSSNLMAKVLTLVNSTEIEIK